MSSQIIETITDSDAIDSSLRYLGTIDGCPLLWDDLTHGPVWPEGEPQDIRYEADGGITIEVLCDVYQAWWRGGGKHLDCGHVIYANGHYVSWIAEQHDECVACAEGRR